MVGNGNYVIRSGLENMVTLFCYVVYITVMSRDLERALKDYEEVYGRPMPVRYNVLHFSDEHRRMDALLRRHYDSFHPLVRDIFTSFSLEFSLLIEKLEKAEEELEELRHEAEKRQEIMENELDDRIIQLKEEKTELEEQLAERDKVNGYLQKELEQKVQILKEKEALIVTQRRQLDLHIEKEAVLATENEERVQQVVKSIESVNEFADQLEELESQIRNLENERQRLLEENEILSSKQSEIEGQYVNEIEEINSLYQELKKEATELSRNVERLSTENSQLRSEISQIKEETSNHLQTKENQKEEIEQKVNELQVLKMELEYKDRELQKVKEKNAKFKELAARILTLKDKVNLSELKEGNSTHETKIVHPAKTDAPKKKWQKRKTSLEAEIEQESDDTGSFSGISLVETDLVLDDSVSRITSKLDQNLSDNDLINSIRRSTRQQDSFEKKATDKLNQAENELNVHKLEFREVDASAGSNLGRLLSKLDGESTDELQLFSKDFPEPPKQELQKKRSDSEKDKTSLHS